MVSVNAMTHNLAAHLSDASKRRQAGVSAIERAAGGIGVLNEINKADVKYFRAYLTSRGLRWFRHGSNAIVWDPSVVKKHRTEARCIMFGGHVGADGTKEGPDNRRVGPNRYNLKWEGEHIATGFPLLVNGTHKVAKGYTSEKWRLPLLLRSHANVVEHLRESLESYPHGYIAGDENSIPYVDYPGFDDVVVETPPTFGPKRYDQIHTFGKVAATGVREWHSPSDHDGLQWVLELGVESDTTPTLPPARIYFPKPGDASSKWRSFGAPVKHPWAERSVRWRKRHAKLWKQIENWRAAYLHRIG